MTVAQGQGGKTHRIPVLVDESDEDQHDDDENEHGVMMSLPPLPLVTEPCPVLIRVTTPLILARSCVGLEGHPTRMPLSRAVTLAQLG